MIGSKTSLKLLFGAAAFVCVAACGGEKAAAPIAADCLPIGDEGAFYVVNADGLLVPAAQPETEVRVLQAPKGWAQDLEATFPDLGYPWMTLNVKGEVATLVGLAPTREAKDRGFNSGEAAIMRDPKGGRQITIVADGIAVEGGEAALGEALSRLSDKPSIAACQRTFADTHSLTQCRAGM